MFLAYTKANATCIHVAVSRMKNLSSRREAGSRFSHIVGHVNLGVPSPFFPGILLFRKPTKTQGKQRTMAERTGEPTPRVNHFPFKFSFEPHKELSLAQGPFDQETVSPKNGFRVCIWAFGANRTSNTDFGVPKALTVHVGYGGGLWSPIPFLHSEPQNAKNNIRSLKMDQLHKLKPGRLTSRIFSAEPQEGAPEGLPQQARGILPHRQGPANRGQEPQSSISARAATLRATCDAQKNARSL